MRDTTIWRRDADQLRQALMKAFRVGNLDAAFSATQAMETLLKRADRPTPAVHKEGTERRLSAMRAWQTRRAAAVSAVSHE